MLLNGPIFGSPVIGDVNGDRRSDVVVARVRRDFESGIRGGVVTTPTVFVGDAKHTGQTVEQVRLDSERDRWFTAKEALEYGFVDHVVSRVAQVANGSGPAPA